MTTQAPRLLQDAADALRAAHDRFYRTAAICGYGRREAQDASAQIDQDAQMETAAYIDMAERTRDKLVSMAEGQSLAPTPPSFAPGEDA